MFALAITILWKEVRTMACLLTITSLHKFSRIGIKLIGTFLTTEIVACIIERCHRRLLFDPHIADWILGTLNGGFDSCGVHRLTTSSK
jgi:hypothetical protein